MWQAWSEGDRAGALAAIPDQVVDDLFVHGPPEACLVHIERSTAAGVTTPVISVLTPGDPMPAIRALAPR